MALIAQQRKEMENLPRVVLWGLLIAVLIGVIGLGVVSLSKQIPLTLPLKATTDLRLPIYGTVPDFSLIDQDGRPVQRADLQGKGWIASFNFLIWAYGRVRMSPP